MFALLLQEPPVLRFAAMAATPDVASVSRGIISSLVGQPAGLQPVRASVSAFLDNNAPGSFEMVCLARAVCVALSALFCHENHSEQLLLSSL